MTQSTIGIQAIGPDGPYEACRETLETAILRLYRKRPEQRPTALWVEANAAVMALALLDEFWEDGTARPDIVAVLDPHDPNIPGITPRSGNLETKLVATAKGLFDRGVHSIALRVAKPKDTHEERRSPVLEMLTTLINAVMRMAQKQGIDQHRVHVMLYFEESGSEDKDLGALFEQLKATLGSRARSYVLQIDRTQTSTWIATAITQLAQAAEKHADIVGLLGHKYMLDPRRVNRTGSFNFVVTC